jgi:preprotein translocase subunit SecG
MLSYFMVFHALISVLLIVIVLLQFGKGAEAGLIGGASDAVFSGAQKGNFLTKVTTVLAAIFLINCIALAKLQSTTTEKSLLDGETPIATPVKTTEATKPEVKKEETKKEEAKTK